MDLRSAMLGLAQEAGPRGYTFAGRVFPPGQTPTDLRQAMMQPAVDSPDAEGLGTIGTAVAAGVSKDVLKSMVSKFDLSDSGFQRWLQKTGNTLSLSKSDDKLISKYITETLESDPIAIANRTARGSGGR